MEASFIFPLVSIAVISFAAFVWYTHIARLAEDDDPFCLKDTFLPFASLSALAAVVLWFLTRRNLDWLQPLSLPQLLFPFIGAGLIYANNLWRPQEGRQNALIALLAVISVFISDTKLNFFPEYPQILSQIILAATIFVAAFAFKYFNAIDGIAATMTLPLIVGSFFLALLGAAPLFYAWFSAALLLIIAAFLQRNWYPAQISWTPAACQAIGFILAYFSLQIAAEGSGPCLIIFALVFFAEVCIAFLKKITFFQEYRNFLANTFYYQINISGLSPSEICRNLLRLELFLVIFGCFELYAPNAYSLPILSFIITLWFLNRLLHWQTPDQSLAEINREVMNDIKKAFNRDDKEP